MKPFFAVIFIFMLIFSPAVLRAHKVQRSEPPIYSFPISLAPSGLDEHAAKILIQTIQKEFHSDFAGRPWQFDFQWQQPYLGAGTSYHENILRIMLWGGMIRAEFMNFGALSALMCHELGHLLAGPPLQILPSGTGETGTGETWAAAEGTSDHYAATICLPRLYKALLKDHPELVAQALLKSPVHEEGTLNRFVAEKCQSHLNKQGCAWVVQSGIDLIEFLQVYFDRDVPFANPLMVATERPQQTIQLEYPTYQCRMQTFVDGGSCAAGKSCAFARCWYAPDKDPH